MPIYEYQCEKCGKVKEIFWKRPPKAALDFTNCTCGGNMTRIISAPSDPVIHGFNAKNSYSHVKNNKKKKEE